MKKALCMLLTLCLTCAAALPAVGEEIVSSAVEAPVSEAWTVGEDNGLSIEVDLPAWDTGEFAVSAAEGDDAVMLGPDEAVEEEAELPLTPGEDVAEDAELERAEPAVEWFEVPGKTVVETFPEDDAPFDEGEWNPEALFAGYVRPIFYGSGIGVPKSTYNTGRELTGKDFIVYDAIKTAAAQIAAGYRASTVVDIPLLEILGKAEFTATELGVDMKYDADGKCTEASKNALSSAYHAMLDFDCAKVRWALKSDCPYEMFWFDQDINIWWTYPTFWYSYDPSRQDTVITVKDNSYPIYIPVVREFAGSEEYTVNTALPSKARQAAAEARRIVAMYANCSDYAKLYGYAAEICKRVKYNTPAIQDDWDQTNQNPWRLIWVFDNDPSTDVVCLGYAEAFSYLCELSAFDSGTRCFIASGMAWTYNGESDGHAWNVVRMDDGKYYVVDTTWMDISSSWADSLPFYQPVTASQVSSLPGGDWFLVGGSGSVSAGYTIATRNGDKLYRNYYDITIAANPASVLTIADRKYVANGFQNIHGKTYFFEGGAYVTGEFGFDGVRYMAGDDGVVYKDWYYRGWKKLDGKMYYFDDNGLHTQHTVVTDKAVLATCTQPGKTEGFHCSVCDTVIVEQDEIAPLGHLWGQPVFTLSEDGRSMTATRTCVHDATHAQSETARVEARVSREATCFDVGETTYTATFRSSAFGTKVITLQDIPAKGHSWGEPTYEWTGNSLVKATRACKNDPGHTEWEGRYTSSMVTLPPSCTQNGETTYTASFTNPAFQQQTRVVADIPAMGHSPVTDKAVAATTAKTGLTEGKHCSVCGKVLVAQQVVPALEPTVKPVSLAKAKVTVKAQVYTGKALKPTVTVKLNGKTLKKGTDYKLSYKNNKYVGKAVVTVKGKGKYTGTAKKAFRINPKAPSGLTLKAGKKVLTAKWQKLPGATGYQLQYATKKSFAGAKTLTLKKSSSVKATVKKLKSKKTYYVRVRTYKVVKGVKYVSAWSKAKSVKVK